MCNSTSDIDGACNHVHIVTITEGIIHLLNIITGTVVNSEFIIIGLTEKRTTFHTTKLYAY